MHSTYSFYISKARPGGFAVRPLGEDVAELRVRELVDAALKAHAEVAPAVARGLEPIT